MEMDKWKRQADEYEDGIYYRLPPLTTGEYILIRNLLSNCSPAYWAKHHTAGMLLEKLRQQTDTFSITDGQAQALPPRRRREERTGSVPANGKAWREGGCRNAG